MKPERALYICFVACISMTTVSCIEEISYFVTEESGRNHLIGNIANDADLASKSQDVNTLRYSLLRNGKQYADKFYVGEINGNLYTNESLDRDKICEFQTECILSIDVVAQSTNGDFYQIKIDINVTDINDNAPEFPQSSVSIHIPEGAILNVSLDGATDKDVGVNSTVRYEIATSGSQFKVYSNNSGNGRPTFRLVSDKVLDREHTGFYQIQVLAFDGGNPPKNGSLSVNVTLTDINDNYPIFSKSTYNVTIMDDMVVGSVVVETLATDEDDGENGEVEYRLSSLQSDDIFDKFSIDQTTGDLLLKKSLKFGSAESYRIIVEASDRAKQPLVSQAVVYVKVKDNHNNNPVININVLSNSEEAEVSEHASRGTVIAHVAVKDTDSGSNGLVTCQVLGDEFKIQKFDENEYKVVIFAILNREVKDRYNVTVMCKDAGVPPRKTYSSFFVVVLDENDNTPIFRQQVYNVSIRENNAIGLKLLKVSAFDDDIGINSDVIYSVSTALDDAINVNNETGEIFLNFSLDREKYEVFSFYVYAADNGYPTLTGSAKVVIYVQDVNDDQPNFRKPNYTIGISENSPPDVIIGDVPAYDRDLGENAEIIYEIENVSNSDLPFDIFQNGSIFATTLLNRETQERYTFRVRASDKGKPSLTGYINVIVIVLDTNDNDPVFIFPSDINRSVAIPYTLSLNSVVTTLKAVDKDSGSNSRLTYYTNDQNMSDIFVINSISGDIILVTELTSNDMGIYKFEVSVKDDGEVPRYGDQVIIINVIDESRADSEFNKYVIIAISMTTVTVVLALLLIIAIYLIRRKDGQKLNNSNASDVFVDKEGLDAGNSDTVPALTRGVYYPPGFDFGTRQFHTIERANSVQVPPTIPEYDVPKGIRSETPILDINEVNEKERHKNQLMTLQYQQSLMRMQNVQRSNSVLTI